MTLRQKTVLWLCVSLPIYYGCHFFSWNAWGSKIVLDDTITSLSRGTYSNRSGSTMVVLCTNIPKFHYNNSAVDTIIWIPPGTDSGFLQYVPNQWLRYDTTLVVFVDAKIYTPYLSVIDSRSWWCGSDFRASGRIFHSYISYG